MNPRTNKVMKMFQIHNYMVGDVVSKSKFSTIRYTRKEDDCGEYAAKCLRKRDVSSQIMNNETILAPLLSHPNILPVREVIDTEKLRIQISQYYPKGDLLSYIISKNQINADNALYQIFNGIKYLHQHYICHRDLKLENILVANDNSYKICDFGFATITFDGMVSGACGSYQYVAPEATGNEAYNGFKADIWSLGVVAYCILAKKFPYSDISNAHYIDFSIIPRKWITIIRRMLSLDPSSRPSITEIINMAFPGVVNKMMNSEPIDIEKPIHIQSNDIISRVSQLFHQPASEIRKEIEDEGPNLMKLLTSLFLERETKDEDGYVIQTPLRCNSVPPSDIPLCFPEELIQKKYSADSNDVLTKMNNFLLSMNACISNPTTQQRSIVLNTQTQKEYVPFTCVQSGDNSSTDLMFTVSPENKKFVSEICKVLDSTFDA